MAVKNLKGVAKVKADAIGGSKKTKEEKLLKAMEKDGVFIGDMYKIKFNSHVGNDRGCEVKDILEVCKKWLNIKNKNNEAASAINKAIKELD